MHSHPQAEPRQLPGSQIALAPAHTPLRHRPSATRQLAFPAALAASLSLLIGCGTPGAPQPPSLKLPEPVVDLAATRSGNSVTLHWTMPRKTTDHLLIATQVKGPLPVEICRRETIAAPCQPSGHSSFAPGAEARFEDQLPPDLTTGPPRQLLYYVQLSNHSGRSAGLSNAALVPAGQVPSPIYSLSAEVTARGVVLKWSPPSGGPAPEPTIRLHRTRLNPPPVQTAPQEPGKNPFPRAPEVAERDLLVHPEPAPSDTSHSQALNTAIDTSVRTGDVYEYSAQRLAQLSVAGQALELLGQPSPPVRVEVVDNFPPAVPSGLVAVYTPAEDTAATPLASSSADQPKPAASAATIDLSWQPDTEEDLAGYIVYRADDSPSGQPGPFTRISGPKPLLESAFRDPNVEPGHVYHYAVSAIDLTGHESERSTPATESVPTNP